MEIGDRIAAFGIIAITIELCRRSVGAGLTSLIPFAIAYAASSKPSSNACWRTADFIFLDAPRA